MLIAISNHCTACVQTIMNHFLKTVFSPILSVFEKGDDSYSYKASHRKILMVIGILFLFLSSVSLYSSLVSSQLGAVIPVVVFSAAGIVCLVVGGLGSDRAVAKIWKSK